MVSTPHANSKCKLAFRRLCTQVRMPKWKDCSRLPARQVQIAAQIQFCESRAPRQSCPRAHWFRKKLLEPTLGRRRAEQRLEERTQVLRMSAQQEAGVRRDGGESGAPKSERRAHRGGARACECARSPPWAARARPAAQPLALRKVRAQVRGRAGVEAAREPAPAAHLAAALLAATSRSALLPLFTPLLAARPGIVPAEGPCPLVH